MAEKDQMLKSVKMRYKIVGNCDALNHALDLALKVARVDLSVIVLGENGSGKEIIPRIIHDASNRRNRKYFALNCGAIPEGTIDSELFGHTEGAFTGSTGKREGYFAAADGGTLFLDEVGELPLQTQVRLLRVLETGEFIPVGASEPRKTNVRIVAATNVDMKRAIREGRFREDLFYRLAAVSINIPPLRDRGNDIDMLFRRFALENQEKYLTPPIRLNEEARRLLLAYPWPGNVRQLKNVVDSMSILCDERDITADVLKQFIPADEHRTQVAAFAPQAVTPHSEVPVDELMQLKLLITKMYGDIKQLRQEVDQLNRNVFPGRKTKDASNASPILIGQDSTRSAAVHMPQEMEFYEEITDEPRTSANTISDDAPRTIQEMEEDIIRRTLENNDGSRRKTAKELNLSERTLYRKIKEYGIDGKIKKQTDV